MKYTLNRNSARISVFAALRLVLRIYCLRFDNRPQQFKANTAPGTMIDIARKWIMVAVLIQVCTYTWANDSARVINTPYEEQKVVFEFYFDHPEKIGTALYWLRAFFHTLMDEPYAYAPDFLDVKVVIHGTELVTLAKKNYAKYKDVVERMRYYSSLGVEFKICALAAKEYDYDQEDFHEFVQIVPNAINEIVHWQSKGYALVTPRVWSKELTIEEIR